MATQRCSGCGAALKFEAEQEVASCEYCGASNRLVGRGRLAQLGRTFLHREVGGVRKVGWWVAAIPALIFIVVAVLVFSMVGGDHDSQVDEMREEHQKAVEEMDRDFDNAVRNMEVRHGPWPGAQGPTLPGMPGGGRTIIVMPGDGSLEDPPLLPPSLPPPTPR